MPFLSGKRGTKVVSDYVRLITDFEAPDWGTWRQEMVEAGKDPREEQFKSSLHCVCALGISFRRLVIIFEEPKYRLLTSTAPGMSRQEKHDIVKGIDQERRACRKCVDKGFTIPWLNRLLDQNLDTQFAAGESLCTIAATSPLASTRVEMAHLLGQEVKPPDPAAGL